MYCVLVLVFGGLVSTGGYFGEIFFGGIGWEEVSVLGNITCVFSMYCVHVYISCLVCFIWFIWLRK